MINRKTNKDIVNKELYPSGIGGQAVLEGIMMRNQELYAVAVRKSDGSVEVKKDVYQGIAQGKKILSLPFIRGIFNFIDSMILGIKTLTYSTTFFDEQEQNPGRFEMWLLDKFGRKVEKFILTVTVVLSICFAIGLFMLLPLLIADTCEKLFSFIGEKQVPMIEGATKILIFVAYLLLISLLKDIQRTFMYHGAEHKCINCIETGKELTLTNVRDSSRFHKRCGTSFLLIVLAISIVIFILIRTKTIWLRYVIRILLIPVIAGISYEFIRFAGRSNHPIINMLSKPGLWMQKITTKEPDDSMIEVAIKAVEAVFDWKEYLRKNGIEIEEDKAEELRRREILRNAENNIKRAGSGYNWKF